MAKARPTTLRGRAIVLRDASGRRIDDIDTDMIFHNAHLHVTELSEMGRYALGNLEGWKDFPSRVRPGDILVAGRNFGCGSSRQQAVDCFRALGVAALVAESFGAIYRRNAINSGFPILTCPGVAGEAGIQDGDEVEVDLGAGTIRDLTRGVTLKGEPFSSVQMDIYQVGGLFAYGRALVAPMEVAGKSGKGALSDGGPGGTGQGGPRAQAPIPGSGSAGGGEGQGRKERKPVPPD